MTEAGEEETGGRGDWGTWGKPLLRSPHPVPQSPTSPSPLLSAAGDPTRDNLLRSPAQRQSIGGDILRDGRARADIGALAHGHGSHELAVAADEGAAPDRGPVFFFSVV